MWGGRVGGSTLGPSLFHRNLNLSIMFLLAKALTLVIISVKLTIFGGARSQKPARKGRFEDAELVRKNLKIFNLTTTNTIMMKLTKIMYLHESVNQKPLRARNLVF